MHQGSYAAEKLSNHVVFHGESAGDVHLCVAPQIFYKNCKKQISESEKIRIFFVRRRKTKCWGSSETCFYNFKILKCECLRGRRSFKVSCTTLYDVLISF